MDLEKWLMQIMAMWDSGKGKITLYKGQEVIKKAVPTANALDELIKLIKDNGEWVDPELTNNI